MRWTIGAKNLSVYMVSVLFVGITGEVGRVGYNTGALNRVCRRHVAAPRAAAWCRLWAWWRNAWARG